MFRLEISLPVRRYCFSVSKKATVTFNCPRHVSGVWRYKYITFNWNDVVKCSHLRRMIAKRFKLLDRCQCFLKERTKKWKNKMPAWKIIHIYIYIRFQQPPPNSPEKWIRSDTQRFWLPQYTNEFFTAHARTLTSHPPSFRIIWIDTTHFLHLLAPHHRDPS